MITLEQVLEALTKTEFDIKTKGLPNMQNEQIYVFQALLNRGRWDVYLPEGEWVGRDQNGWPTYPEQMELLNRFTKNSNPSQGAWYFEQKKAFEDFILEILPYIVYI